MTLPRALLDANVLFPFTLRDTLLRCAALDLFTVLWSAQILEEMRRSLVRSGRVTEPQAQRLLEAMTAAFPEALVTGYEGLVAAMPNEPEDWHVAAAALHGGAQILVTQNLRHFEPLPEGLEGQHPDVFLCDLLSAEPDSVLFALRVQAAALRSPPRSFEQVVAGLAKSVPAFAAAVLERTRERG